MKEIDSKSLRSISIGCLSDWTMLPLRKELQKLEGKVNIHLSSKTNMAKLLETSRVAVAPCSSICLIRNPKFELALPLGIALKGRTGALYVGLNNIDSDFIAELNQRIALLREIFSHANITKTKDIGHAAGFVWRALKELPEARFKKIPIFRFSRIRSSTDALARILYRMLFGASAYESNERINTAINGSSTRGYSNEFAYILAGNEALQHRCQFSATIDLDQIWSQISGLPFVYSVWQRQNNHLNLNVNMKILKVAELAQVAMQVEPSSYLPDIIPLDSKEQPIDLASLWKCVSYSLGPEEMKGLLLFLNLARPLERIAVKDNAFAIKMIRMQQRENDLISAGMYS